MSEVDELTVEARRRPQSFSVWVRLADALAAQGHISAARASAGRAKDRTSSCQDWLETGQLLKRLDDPHGAVLAFREASRFYARAPSGEVADAYRELGAGLLELGDIDAGVLGLRVAVRLEPEHGETHRRLAEGLERAGRVDEALRHADRALELGVQSPEIHRIRARASAQLGREDDCMEALHALSALAPGDVSAAIKLGAHLASEGDREGALQLLSKAEAKMERTWGSVLRLGQARTDLGDFAGALRLMREAVCEAPERSDTHLGLGLALEAVGAIADAVVAYETAVKLAPNSAEARHRLGLALGLTGRKQESVDVLVQAAALDPANPEVQDTLVSVLGTRSSGPESPPPPSSTPNNESFSGDLAVFALSEVLEFFLVHKASGRLEVDGEAGLGSVELYLGHIVTAHAPGVSTLSQRLEANGLKLGSMDGVDGLDEAYLLPQWLLEKRQVDPGQLQEQINALVREALGVMVSWTRGKVRFHTRPTPVDESITAELSVDPRWALLELARAGDERAS